MKKKIANLRNDFTKEHAKANNSMKSGAYSAFEIHVSKLWYYHLSAFTGDHEWQI